jgi:hypothetical protein
MTIYQDVYALNVRVQPIIGELFRLTSTMFQGIMKLTSPLFKTVVLSLGSLHLTLMAAVGIWLWSSPLLFESSQPQLTQTYLDLPFECTSIAVLGYGIKLTSPGLQRWSLIIYSCFLVPGLNLLLPAILFLALHIGFHSYISHLLSKKFGFSKENLSHLSVVPISIGLGLLLAINIVFLVDIETTISRAKSYRQSEESEWTFGQTLALLLLSLPMRDVGEFIRRTRAEQRRQRCTKGLKEALEEPEDFINIANMREFAKHADVRVAATGMLEIIHICVMMIEERTTGTFPSALQFAAYIGDLPFVKLLIQNGAHPNVEGEVEDYNLLTLMLMNEYRRRVRASDSGSSA